MREARNGGLGCGGRGERERRDPRSVYEDTGAPCAPMYDPGAATNAVAPAVNAAAVEYLPKPWKACIIGFPNPVKATYSCSLYSSGRRSVPFDNGLEGFEVVCGGLGDLEEPLQQFLGPVEFHCEPTGLDGDPDGEFRQPDLIR
jgi:hypothetical protein